MTDRLRHVNDFELRKFDPAFAALVAGWVQTPEELFMLAPATEPPLSADKVLAWTEARNLPLLLWPIGGDAPVGYSELNFMSHDARDLWIGHFIVPESSRGKGFGYAFMRLLLRRAFASLSAASVSLVVFPENEVAVNCYLKCGLVKDGIHVKGFRHLPGKYKMRKMKISSRQYRRWQTRFRSID